MKLPPASRAGNGRPMAVAPLLAALACGLAACDPAVPEGRLATLTNPPATYTADKATLDRHPLPEWWQDAKFGIFIHWGVYSIPAYAPPERGKLLEPDEYAEWYWYFQQREKSKTWEHHRKTYGEKFLYDDFIPQWKAERYDPAQWASIIKGSGAKYFVLTTKHHDGFALWPSAIGTRNAGAMGPQRDLVGELVTAARADGLKVGLYYSMPEWFTPKRPKTEFPPDGSIFKPAPPINAYTGQVVPYTGNAVRTDYATDVARPQVRELIDRYRPDIFWCDVGATEDYYKSNGWIAQLYNEAKAHNPEGVVVNDRCGDKKNTHADFNTVEYGLGSAIVPFEATQGMGMSFGYNAQETEAHMESTGELIHRLAATVALGGNLLLDIGPRADGSIPQPMLDRLNGIGQWLEINGEAIYGSRAWAAVKKGREGKKEAYTYFTRGKSGDLYAIASVWPGKSLRINAAVPTAAGTRVILLGGDGKPLTWRTKGKGIEIDMPVGGSAATRSRHAFVFKISAPGGVAR